MTEDMLSPAHKNHSCMAVQAVVQHQCTKMGNIHSHISLWLLLRRHGAPDKIVSIMQTLHTDTHSCVRVDEVCSDWFEILGGVCQGCAIAPGVFLAPVDWIMQCTLKRSLGVNISCQIFMDLRLR